MWRVVVLVWEYQWGHDQMGLRVYRELCRKYCVKCAYVWYGEVPDAGLCSHWDHLVSKSQVRGQG